MRPVLFAFSAFFTIVAAGFSAFGAAWIMEGEAPLPGAAFLPFLVFWVFSGLTAVLGWFWFITSKGNV